MALTAEEIQNVSFSIDRKGYDVDEVDVFLEHVADEVDAMNRVIADLEGQLNAALEAAPIVAAVTADSGEADDEAAVAEKSSRVAELEKQLDELEQKLAEKSANDSAISQALIVAQRSADDIVAAARTEASNIIKDADEEADRIIGKAESDRLKIAEAIRTLENDRSDVRTEYRNMLSNFMADAQRKLAEIDGDTRRSAATSQARVEANSAGYAASSLSSVSVARESSFASPAASTPMAEPAPSGYVEKDLSGYGDAVDDFSLDID